MLVGYGIKYQREFSFDDLLSDSGNKLRFDFAVFNQDRLIGLIEYQGEQHYIVANSGFGKYQREVSDTLKRNYCQLHQIPLYEIKYDDDLELCVRNILISMGIIASYADTVPSIEQDEGVTTISQEST